MKCSMWIFPIRLQLMGVFGNNSCPKSAKTHAYQFIVICKGNLLFGCASYINIQWTGDVGLRQPALGANRHTSITI